MKSLTLRRFTVGWMLICLVPVGIAALWILFEGKVRRRSLAFSLVSDVNEYIHQNPAIASPVEWQAFANWSRDHNNRTWNADDMRPRFVVSSKDLHPPRKWRVEVLEGELKSYENALNERLNPAYKSIAQ